MSMHLNLTPRISSKNFLPATRDLHQKRCVKRGADDSHAIHEIPPKKTILNINLFKQRTIAC